MSIDSGAVGSAGGQMATSLDEVDRSILRVLAKDGRISIRTLAERLHISRTNAYARIDRLVGDKVITGFGARIDPARAGLGTTAMVVVTIEQASWREVSEQLRSIQYVEHLTMVGGDFDVLVLVRAPDNQALREIVLERIQEVLGVRSTRTWLVFDEVTGTHPGLS